MTIYTVYLSDDPSGHTTTYTVIADDIEEAFKKSVERYGEGAEYVSVNKIKDDDILE